MTEMEPKKKYDQYMNGGYDALRTAEQESDPAKKTAFAVTAVASFLGALAVNSPLENTGNKSPGSDPED